MKRTKLVNLPIIGNIQHGEKINNKVTEYGYFIAKTKNAYMQPYIEKFNNLFKGKQSIDIRFFDEDPLTKKYARYNQGGEACRCLENSEQAIQKVKNGWKEIHCPGIECQYRQKNATGKCACNRIGCLKFLIPSISNNRIFLIKITGQTSINQLNDYIALQKLQGNSIKGDYTLFLYQKKQYDNSGQVFNNYILDILKKEDFYSSEPIPQITQNQKELSTKNTQDVNNKVVKQESNQNATTQENSTNVIQETKTDTSSEKKQEKETTSTKETKSTTASTSTKKQTKSKTKKTGEKEQEKETKTLEPTNTEPINKCFALLNSFYKSIKDKDGKEKKYLVGEFVDMDDKIIHIFINPIYENELLECGLGTLVKLEDIRDVEDKKFVMKLEVIEKTLKNVAA